MAINSATSGNPTRKGRIVKTIYYGSGRVAGYVDDNIIVEIGPSTYWIWGYDKHGLEQIIYTTESKQWVNEHIRVKKIDLSSVQVDT